LITGGFGYLGGRIAIDVARHTSYQVRLASRRKQPPPSWLQEAQTVAFDLLKSEAFDGALDQVEAVVHLAALNEIQSLESPQKAVEVNTLGTLNLLNAAIRAKVKRFIYFSTAHVYGAPLAGHITESSLPRPTHPYAITHHAAEEFVLAARDKAQIEGIVIRLSNGFGAPTHAGVDRWTLAVNAFCRQAVLEKELLLTSSGSQQRDFITLHDVGRAVSHFLDLPHSKCADGLFNVGGECTMTILAMAEQVIKCCPAVLGYGPKLERPKPTGEKPLGLNFDISKLKQTGFVLNGNMDEEIKQTLKICLSMGQGQKG
jgi:UDP-glucose 4-epimerase